MRGARVLEAGDPRMPASLSPLDPPVARLWVAGADPPPLQPRIAIVGSRTPTPYGEEVAQMLAADLAAAGFCIVSGMARGIDAAAHRGALAAGGCTVAVLGSGIDKPYPSSNRPLFEQIVRTGCALTEYEPGTSPYPKHFPERNRIIAGLSLGVVVVQAAGPKAGAMGTARWAERIGRTVFAVPGDIRAEVSQGPHDLIRDGAVLCARAGDVLEALRTELGWVSPTGEAAAVPPDLPSDERAVLEALTGGPADPAALARRCGASIDLVSRALVRLEMAGLVQADLGGLYRRAR